MESDEDAHAEEGNSRNLINFSAAPLTPKEIELVEWYRHLDGETQTVLKEWLRTKELGLLIPVAVAVADLVGKYV